MAEKLPVIIDNRGNKKRIAVGIIDDRDIESLKISEVQWKQRK